MIGIYMVPKLTSDIRYFVLKFMSEMSILILLLFQWWELNKLYNVIIDKYIQLQLPISSINFDYNYTFFHECNWLLPLL